MVLSPIGGLLTGRLLPGTALRLGLAGFALATAAILITLHLSAIWWFLAVSAIAGIAQGSANAAGIANAIRVAARMVREDITRKITDDLGRLPANGTPAAAAS